MEIQNLSPLNQTKIQPAFSIPLIIGIVILATTAGFWLSRISPATKNINQEKITAVSAENINNQTDLKVGVLYGNQEKNFKDTAIGTLEKGSINGEGTHILNREGGLSQRASLTSSTVDLDLFVGKKVEVQGETNASNKTGWLLDIGNIKILE